MVHVLFWHGIPTLCSLLFFAVIIELNIFSYFFFVFAVVAAAVVAVAITSSLLLLFKWALFVVAGRY